MNKVPMQLPYGAVYFRKSNPPKADWERDYQQAAKDGINIFRHWFMWGSIEVEPGVFDWEDFDRQMELAERYSIKTIIAEITTSVPEWVFRLYPEAVSRYKNGEPAKSQMGVSSATGGFYEGVCLDTPVGRKLVGNFLTELAKRYKGHPALMGYDVWNECNYSHTLCFCESTKSAYREWLKEKYGSLENLRKAWYRYSLADWQDVQPPAALQLYPECYDWLTFRKENAYRHMQWKVDLIRNIDPECLITAHGTAQSLENMALGGSDEWLAADKVELYGLTFVQSRQGNEPYKQYLAMDLTRAGAKEKPFWHAESQAGPLWYQPQVVNRPREDGRVTEPEDIRQWNLTSLACGARGILCPRWRPLLDGPLFGAFGGYAMDGSSTENSEMCAKIAHWANDPAQKDLMEAKPVRGELGIIVSPKVQITTALLSAFGAKDHYKEAMVGAYRAFFDLGYQPEFVHIQDISKWKTLYFPLPMQMDDNDIERLTQWVAAGGTLVSEGCLGYFDDRGKVRENMDLRLQKMLGIDRKNVEFTPDLLQNEIITVDGNAMYGGEYLEKYTVRSARVLATDSHGDPFITENRYGKGCVLMVGTSPAVAYASHTDFYGQRVFFRWVAEKQMAIIPRAISSNPKCHVRMQCSENGCYVWIINSERTAQHAWISLPESGAAQIVEKVCWEGGSILSAEEKLEVVVEGRNALIIKVKK